MFCSEYCLVKNEFPTITIIPLRCRCWSCDECRPERTRRLIGEAKSGKPDLFITLTSRYRTDRSPSWAAQELVKCWRTIRRELVKERGKGSVPFLAVFEETKRGWPHLHIVARAEYIEHAWLKKRMTELHNSPVCWVERLTSTRKIANYVAKYIGKNPHRFARVKRYWRSLDYLDPPPDDGPLKLAPPDGWRIERTNWLDYAKSIEDFRLEIKYERFQVIMTQIPREQWKPPLHQRRFAPSPAAPAGAAEAWQASNAWAQK